MEDRFEYELVRSRRKTISLIVRRGQVIVRAPYRMPGKEIVSFVEGHAAWVLKKLTEQRESQKTALSVRPLTARELENLREQASSYIPRRVAFFAPLVGVSCGSITIRPYKSKWGSCTADGRLAFNTLLMLAPPDVIDSVVVHELCHRKVMNHSAAFYREVLRVCPDYHEKHEWLKKNRDRIMALGGYS